ncbi:MAG: lysylphosphatidylglycerol synthase domain-containing protein [Patescibacteria group bacterium]|nr:lysylphosphatidylglycerol synthase domain-containing protein [Patescibacteria group bacterium]
MALVVALYRGDYVQMPSVVLPAALALSFVNLIGGFFAAVYCWRLMLRHAGCNASFFASLASYGLSLPGKFLPGKVWAIAGRASYLRQYSQCSFARLSLVSIETQVAELWTGLSLGAVGLAATGGLRSWGGFVLAVWLIVTGAALLPRVPAVAQLAKKRLCVVSGVCTSNTLASYLTVLPWFFLAWLLWAVGFYFMTVAILGKGQPWTVGLAFPLATSLGILAVVAPGGLGVREGVLSGYLILAGFSVVDATTVAVASRLWFLIGELFILGSGIAASTCDGKQRISQPPISTNCHAGSNDTATPDT